MHQIPLAYDSLMLDYANRHQYIAWNTDLHPNLAILGNSGSGKSYFLRLILGRVSQVPGAKAYVCCYKNELLKANTPRFWGYKEVIAGFEQFYEDEFVKRLNGDSDRSFRLLLIDEYISWLASMDSKEAEKVKRRMAECLFMFRSLNLHCILGCHRGMATDFSHGSRDCLNIIFLGSPSKESVRSFCTGEEAEFIKKRGRGEGYTIFDGQPPVAITVPTVRDAKKLDEAIIRLVTD